MPDPSDHYVTRVEYTRDRTESRVFIARAERLLERLEQILEERSGDRREIEQMQRDIEASHVKHRQHYKEHKQITERFARIETRQMRLWYGLLGALAVIEIVVRLIPQELVQRIFL